MAKWIVTGGCGFIGVNASRTLVEEGHDVVVVDNLARPSSHLNRAWLADEVGDCFSFVEADIRDVEAMNRLLSGHGDADVVLHLAAQVAVTTSVTHPREDLDINVVGTFVVLDAMRRLIPQALFLNASTNKVFGDLARHRVGEGETRYVDLDFPQGIAEDHPLDPHSPYGCSKASAESYVLDFPRIYGINAVSLRQSCIYGPRQFGVEDQGWVAWFALAVALGLPLTVYGTGKQVRDLLHVDDLVRLYLAVAERADACNGRAFNVGGGPANTLSVVELLERLGGPAVAQSNERPGDQKVFVADVTSAEETLGWTPRIALEQGLDDLLVWVEQHKREAADILRPSRARTTSA